MAGVIRRLLRVCMHYQQNVETLPQSLPQFIMCSATIGNPLEHFLNLVSLSAIMQQSNIYCDSGTLKDKSINFNVNELEKPNNIEYVDIKNTSINNEQNGIQNDVQHSIHNNVQNISNNVGNSRQYGSILDHVCVIDNTLDGSPAGER